MKKTLVTRIMAVLLSTVLVTGFAVSGAFSTSIQVEAADKATTAALKSEFDADFYASKYPDIKAAFGTNKDAMFNHFLTCGMKEGRMMNANFDPLAYTAAYPDVKATCKANDYSNAYIHYVTFGKKENRTLTTNNAVAQKAQASKNVLKTSKTTYQLNVGHGLTVYLSENQYRSCTIKVYKSDNGYAAFIDGNLYDTSGNFNGNDCYQYSSISVNNGNCSESIYSAPSQQVEQIYQQPTQQVQPTPQPTPTPDPEPEIDYNPDDIDFDFDDDEEISDEEAAYLYILTMLAIIQEKYENGEISEQEYQEALARLGL